VLAANTKQILARIRILFKLHDRKPRISRLSEEQRVAWLVCAGENGTDGQKGRRGKRGRHGETGQKGDQGDQGVKGPPGQLLANETGRLHLFYI